MDELMADLETVPVVTAKEQESCGKEQPQISGDPGEAHEDEGD